MQCKAQCMTQKVETGVIVSSPADCRGFVRARKTKDGKEATDDDVVECRGVADKDSFQSGRSIKESSDEWDAFLYDEYPELDQCGDGSFAVVRGITAGKVAVETGDANGHPAMRAFSIVCVGAVSSSIPADVDTDRHPSANKSPYVDGCEDTPDWPGLNMMGVQLNCEALAKEDGACENGDVKESVKPYMIPMWDQVTKDDPPGKNRPECHCKVCGKCNKGGAIFETRSTPGQDPEFLSCPTMTSSTFASLESNTKASQVSKADGLTIFASGVTIVNQNERTSHNGSSLVEHHSNKDNQAQQNNVQEPNKSMKTMERENVETDQRLEAEAAEIEML